MDKITLSHIRKKRNDKRKYSKSLDSQRVTTTKKIRAQEAKHLNLRCNHDCLQCDNSQKCQKAKF